jgi:hypothetical protein
MPAWHVLRFLWPEPAAKRSAVMFFWLHKFRLPSTAPSLAFASSVATVTCVVRFGEDGGEKGCASDEEDGEELDVGRQLIVCDYSGKWSLYLRFYEEKVGVCVMEEHSLKSSRDLYALGAERWIFAVSITMDHFWLEQKQGRCSDLSISTSLLLR